MQSLRSTVHLLSIVSRSPALRGIVSSHRALYSTAPPPPRPLIPEAEFHSSADALLASLETSLCAIEDDLDSSDISLAMGVLTIKLGGAKAPTFVLNKQTPTRQVWWSSPVSGPRRFEFDGSKSEWYDAKNGAELRAELARELTNLTGKKVAF